VSALTPTPRPNSSSHQIGAALKGAQALAKQHRIRIRLHLEGDWLRVSGYRSKRNSATGVRSERRSRCCRVDSYFGAEQLVAMVAEVTAAILDGRSVLDPTDAREEADFSAALRGEV